MKKLSRLTALLLCLSLCLGVWLVPASAANTPFSDVPSGAWYEDSVQYAYENGLMNGVGGGRFNPNGTATRAMVVTILHRMAGEPSSSQIIFNDVPLDAWYFDSIFWAYDHDILTGYGNGSMGPNKPVTREQLVTILYRYAEYCGYDLSASNRLYAFSDRSSVHGWAFNAISWSVGAGIITGIAKDGGAIIQPTGTAKRSQIATIMMRFIQYFDDDPSNDPAVPEDPDPSDSFAGSVDSIQVQGMSYQLGMSVSTLIAQAGQPDETLTGFDSDATWYVYGTDTYENFFMAHVKDGVVYELCAGGPSVSFMDHHPGQPIDDAMDQALREAVQQPGVHSGVDGINDGYANDNIIFYILYDNNIGSDSDEETAQTLYAECRLNFHLVNAYRAIYGLQTLKWSESAATAARLHCEDMRDQNYFEHDSLDGRTVVDRLDAQGISYRACGENIAWGQGNGFTAFNSWLNSYGHRQNMLYPTFTHLGVGASTGPYWTQDFYIEW